MPATGTARVLVVDDEVAALRTVEAILEDRFHVELAGSAERALQLASRTLYDVVCTDYVMPQMNGADLLRSIARAGHVIGGVLVTGRAEQLVADELMPDGGVLLTILRKPYDPEELLQAIDRAATFARMKRTLQNLGRTRS